VGLAKCLKVQGLQDIASLVAEPETVPQHLTEMLLDVREDVFHWDRVKGWAMQYRCVKCGRERCDRCEVRTFEDVVSDSPILNI
jgi:hypothetical protein